MLTRLVISYDDLRFQAKTLDDIKAQIDKKPKAKKLLALRVIGIPEYVRGTKPKTNAPLTVKATITGINRTSRKLQLGELVSPVVDLDDVLADTPANKKLLEDFQAARELYNDLSHVVEARTIKADGYGRIDPNTYDDHLSKLQSSYDNSKMKGN